MKSQLRVLALFSSAYFDGLRLPGRNYYRDCEGRRWRAVSGRVCHGANTKTKITVNVLSDSQGHYRIEQLPAGDYRVQIKAVGFTAAPQNGVTLTADQNTSFDFALQKGTVRWNEISFYQANAAVPFGEGKRPAERALRDLPPVSEPLRFGEARCRWLEGPRGVHAHDDAGGTDRPGCRRHCDRISPPCSVRIRCCRNLPRTCRSIRTRCDPSAATPRTSCTSSTKWPSRT